MPRTITPRMSITDIVLLWYTASRPKGLAGASHEVSHARAYRVWCRDELWAGTLFVNGQFSTSVIFMY